MAAGNSKVRPAYIALAFASVLFVCFPGVSMAAECPIRFDLKPASSTLSVAGTVLRPISVPITMDNDSAVGLFGSMFVNIKTDSTRCPETAEELASISSGATFQFVAPPIAAYHADLHVYPSKLDVVVKLGPTVFAELSFYDVTLEILTEEFTLEMDEADFAAAASGNGNGTATRFSILTLWRVTGGTGAAVSAVLGNDGPSFVDLGGLNTTVKMEGVFDFKGRQVILDAPMTASFDLKDGDIAVGVEASVNFDSIVDAVGYLGCPDSCIHHGKCISVPNTETGVDDIGCMCECGWTGQDCSIPFGFCSNFPNATSQQVVYASLPSTPSTWDSGSNAQGNASDVDILLEDATAKAATCDLLPEECVNNTVYNGAKCECECQVGWAGSSCELCTNNAACQIAGTGKECDTTLVYSNRTIEKHYSCVLRENDPIRKFLEGDIRTRCDVKTRSCHVRLASFSDDMPHISCNVSDCTFTDQSGHVNCNHLDCDCHEDLGCPEYFSEEIITIMRNAKGIKAGVLCDEVADDWVCEVSIEGLPITIEGLCIQGTCLDGSESANIAGALANVSPPGLVLAIAGLVGGVLLALGAFFLGTNLWRMKLKRILSVHGRYGGSTVSNLLLPGSTFSFEDITCKLYVTQTNSRISPTFLKGIFRKDGSDNDGSTRDHLSEIEMRSSARRSKSSRYGGHCSLEKFPDTVDNLCEMSQTDLCEQKSHHRVILHSIGGSLSKGLVMAIMGPSGSGKSTLLNILAGGATQISNCQVSGSIKVDGQKRDQWFHKIAAHVPQEDNQIPTLTVRECVMYSAMLRLPWHWDKKLKLSHVDQVLKELGLKHVAHSQVGGSAAIRGVSGGEKRRVSIGMELVTSPKILFLDEPTSGLDSFTAAQIMTTLTKLARNGRMVFLSLHQPSEAVFNELDKVLLLARGHSIYCGDADGVRQYFSDMGFPCPPTTSNIADHILEVVSRDESCLKLIADSKNKIQEFKSYSARSTESNAAVNDRDGVRKELVRKRSKPGACTVNFQRENSREIKVGLNLEPLDLTDEAIENPISTKAAGLVGPEKASRHPVEVEDLTPGTRAVLELSPRGKGELVDADAHQPLDRELLILFWRTWTDTIRHPALLRLHVIVSVLVGAASAIIFQNVPGDLAGMQNRAGCLFFTLTFFAFGSLTSIDLFIAERAVFNRELRGSYYRIGTYFFAKATLDGVLLRILPAMLYGLVVYWSIGLRPEISHVMVFFATLSLFNLAAGSLSMVIAVISPTAGFASLSTIVILLIALLFGGFLANAESMPVWLRWLQHLSIFYYGFEILFVNEVHGLEVNFDAAGLDVNVKGDLFLDTFNFSEEDLPMDIVALFGIYIGLLLVAYALLSIFHASNDVKVKRANHTSRMQRWWGTVRNCGQTKTTNSSSASTKKLSPSSLPSSMKKH